MPARPAGRKLEARQPVAAAFDVRNVDEGTTPCVWRSRQDGAVLPIRPLGCSSATTRHRFRHCAATFLDADGSLISRFWHASCIMAAPSRAVACFWGLIGFCQT